MALAQFPCLEEGETCKKDGSLGYCCLPDCFQLVGTETWICSDPRTRTVETTIARHNSATKCLEKGVTCKSDGSLGNCCSQDCFQLAGAETGICTEPKPTTSETTLNGTPKPDPKLVAGCLRNNQICKSDSTLGICCSTACLQYVGHDTGICVPKQGNSTVSVDGSGVSSVGLAIGLTFAFVAIIALLIGVIFLRRKMKQIVFSEADIYRFRRGCPNNAHAEMPMHEKVDISPYDASYEIIPSKFTIENQVLGSGEFGVVRKASIQMLPNAEVLAVAAKTTVEGADARYINALLSELKLMIYIGTHDNIVTLVGASTTDLKKGRAYLFLEFCYLGSLEKHLRKKKSSFGDVNSPCANVPNYIGTLQLDPDPPLTSADLYTWSIQIANALSFLSEKKVVHGDLATRNILLVNRSLAKISDFGLSRRVYDYTNYVKKHQEPLPWKWMAIESLQELSFSPLSDLWSYGVTLWEIFSLGSTPYPGLSWTTDFAQKVVDGLRLPSPQFGSQKVYDIMVACWNIDPELRPRPEVISRQLTAIKSNPN